MNHLSIEALEAGLELVRRAPVERGVLCLIVRRPRVGARELLDEGMLDVVEGLVGDSWKARGCRKTPDGSAHPDMQINIMNARAAALVVGDRADATGASRGGHDARRRWALAGDQLYVDLDLSSANLPPGTRLSIGDAVLEVTAEPHTGCKKFVARFGLDAMKFVNSPVGRELNLRGINAKVVRSGTVRTGDAVVKL